MYICVCICMYVCICIYIYIYIYGCRAGARAETLRAAALCATAERHCLGAEQRDPTPGNHIE